MARPDRSPLQIRGASAPSASSFRGSTIGGYLVNLDKQILEGAPTYGMDEDFRWTSDYGRQVDK